jgi:hypothetical protein
MNDHRVRKTAFLFQLDAAAVGQNDFAGKGKPKA